HYLDLASQRKGALTELARLGQRNDRGGELRLTDDAPPVAIRAVKASASRVKEEAVTGRQGTGLPRTSRREGHSLRGEDPRQRLPVLDYQEEVLGHAKTLADANAGEPRLSMRAGRLTPAPWSGAASRSGGRARVRGGGLGPAGQPGRLRSL